MIELQLTRLGIILASASLGLFAATKANYDYPDALWTAMVVLNVGVLIFIGIAMILDGIRWWLKGRPEREDPPPRRRIPLLLLALWICTYLIAWALLSSIERKKETKLP